MDILERLKHNHWRVYVKHNFHTAVNVDPYYEVTAYPPHYSVGIACRAEGPNAKAEVHAALVKFIETEFEGGLECPTKS